MTVIKRPTTKLKKRKKTRYKVGIHISLKCKQPVNYRSGWERALCQYLDANNEVVEYWYESVKIPYLSPKAKKPRFYIPDFLVLFSDGTLKMIEVKRENQLSNIWVKAKAEAATRWCGLQNPKIVYEFCTDKFILPLVKLYKTADSATKRKKRKKNEPKNKS